MRLSFYRTGASSKTVDELKKSELVQQIYLLAQGGLDETQSHAIEGCEVVEIDGMQSSHTVKKIANLATADYTLIYLKPTVLKLGYFALDRMARIADDTGAGMVYLDYYAVANGRKRTIP